MYTETDLFVLVNCGCVVALMSALDALQLASGDVFLCTVRESLAHQAIRCNQTPVLRALIQRGIDVNRHYGGLTLLQTAAQLNCATAVPVLLDAGADPKPWIRTTSKQLRLSPMILAIENGATQVVRELLARVPQLANECSPSLSVRKALPLHESVRSKEIDIVRLLLAAGADVAATEDDGTTALHWAVRHRDALAMTELLLDAGAPIDACSRDGKTPLMSAMQLDTMRLLLERGADVNVVVRHHNVFTTLEGDDDRLLARIALLVRAGGTLDAMTLRAHFRLRNATSWSRAQMVTWLLACDVDPDGEPNAQQPVISVCNAVDIAALFVAAGATMSAESIARFDADAIAAAGEDARRKLCRARFLLMRYRALEIATALQFLKLPALVTLYILDAAHQLAPKVPMHLKWTLVTKVKHFIRVTK